VIPVRALVEQQRDIEILFIHAKWHHPVSDLAQAFFQRKFHRTAHVF
jgi:hypothetical protein